MKLQNAIPARFLTQALALLLLLPLFSQISQAQAATSAVEIPKRVRLRSDAAEKMLTSKVPPIYPLLAKQSRIQGTVILKAIIGIDGSIEVLHLIQGHPLLAQAAMDAVKRWKYKPYLSNGKPVEVETMITVNFKLSSLKTENRTNTGSGSGSGTKVGLGKQADIEVSFINVGSGVSAAELVYAPDPTYSDEAMKASLEGMVGLTIFVGAEGRVHIPLVFRSLGKGLDEKAIEAVKTWRFKPAMKDGKPVPVQAIVKVNFHLH
jgi:TonB family protein